MSTNKRVIVFNRGDFPEDIENANVIYVQNTVEIGGKTKNRVIVPYNVQSFPELHLRRYRSQPVIGFVGYIPRISPGRILRSVKPPTSPIKKNSAIVRRLALIQTEKSFEKTQIIRRASYGGALKLIKGDFREHRNQYLENLQNCDISLSPRGDGNGSQRFFESLAAGRIPLLPDTNIVFPKLCSNLNMNYISMRADSCDIKSQVESFWTSLSHDKYSSLQSKNYLFFNNMLRYDSFMKKLFESTESDFYSNYVY